MVFLLIRLSRKEDVMPQNVLTTINEGIARIVLNRPESYNALDGALLGELAESVTRLSTDNAVRAVIITGAGKAFCSGGDLKYMHQESPDAPGDVTYRLAATFHKAIIEIRRMSKPVIAAINGPAAGAGMSIALACDFRVMAQSAVFRQAFSMWGLSMDGSGTFSLPRLVGLARALEIVAFDEPISAAKALEWGLVTRVVEDDRAVDEAEAMARMLAARSLHAFGQAKRLLTDSFNTPLEVQLERERAAVSACANHPDGREGIRAFVEKRQPVFIA